MTDQASRWQKRFEIPVTVAALATIPLLIVEQSNAGQPWQVIASIGDWAAWLVFFAELVVLLAVAPSRRAYLREHPIDLVVVVLTPPFAPPAIQAIRVLRMLRVLRLVRLGPLLRRLFSLEGLEYAALLAAVTLVAGAESFAVTENVSFGTGVYWGIETMTTVGYGDVAPTTTLGKVVACVLMLVGIGFFALITGAVAEHFLATEVEKVEAGEVEIEAEEAEIIEQVQALDEQVRTLAERIRTLEESVRKRAQTKST